MKSLHSLSIPPITHCGGAPLLGSYQSGDPAKADQVLKTIRSIAGNQYFYCECRKLTEGIGRLIQNYFEFKGGDFKCPLCRSGMCS